MEMTDGYGRIEYRKAFHIDHLAKVGSGKSEQWEAKFRRENMPLLWSFGENCDRHFNNDAFLWATNRQTFRTLALGFPRMPMPHKCWPLLRGKNGWAQQFCMPPPDKDGHHPAKRRWSVQQQLGYCKGQARRASARRHSPSPLGSHWPSNNTNGESNVSG